MRYVDTSVLVSIVTPEDTTERAVAWLRASDLGTLHASDWVTAELAAALTRKVRTGRLTLADRDTAFQKYNELIDGSFAVVPIETENIRATWQIVLDPAAGIRAGDALHLALAAAHDLSLATFDKRLAAGAIRLGHRVELLA